MCTNLVPSRIAVLRVPEGDVIATIEPSGDAFRLAPGGEVYFYYAHAPARCWHVNSSLGAFLEAVRIFNQCGADVCEFFEAAGDAEPEATWVLERLRLELGQIEPLGDPASCLWSATVEDAEGGLLRLY